MDTEIAMIESDSPMETASPRDVDISNEVSELRTSLRSVVFLALLTS